MNESHLIDTSEYTISQNIQGEPAFNWWAPHFIKKHEQIILLVKKQSTRYLKKTHTFGVRPPKSVYKAYKIDAHNGNFLWTNAIAKKVTDGGCF